MRNFDIIKYFLEKKGEPPKSLTSETFTKKYNTNPATIARYWKDASKQKNPHPYGTDEHFAYKVGIVKSRLKRKKK